MRFRFVLVVALLLAAPPVAAQTAADSAEVVLNAARILQREGRGEAARQLLLFIRARYGTTPAARAADSLLGSLPAPVFRQSGGSTGRTGFILFYTVYGGFLGLAIPAALGAEGSEAFGAGLLLGAPAGYFGSRAFARAKISRPGQAGVASFATTWGTWQGLLLQQVLHIGRQEVCYDTGLCFKDDSNAAPWAAMVIGGLAGLGVGGALVSHDIPTGTSTLVSHSAFWGSWFGLSLARVFGAEDDALFGAMLVGGNAALLAAIPAAKAWRPNSSNVRLATAAGLAGGLGGLGIGLLVNVDDDKTALGIAAAASAVGLIAGAAAAKNRRDADEAEPPGLALLTIRNGARLRLPIPIPAAIPSEERGVRRWRPGVRWMLLDANF